MMASSAMILPFRADLNTELVVVTNFAQTKSLSFIQNPNLTFDTPPAMTDPTLEKMFNSPEDGVEAVGEGRTDEDDGRAEKSPQSSSSSTTKEGRGAAMIVSNWRQRYYTRTEPKIFQMEYDAKPGPSDYPILQHWRRARPQAALPWVNRCGTTCDSCQILELHYLLFYTSTRCPRSDRPSSILGVGILFRLFN